MWCVFLGFVGGLVAAPVIGLGLGGGAVVKRVVKGGIVVGDTVSDWAHARRDDWHHLVQEARTELHTRRDPNATNRPTI
jgi:hypothetical protein